MCSNHETKCKMMAKLKTNLKPVEQPVRYNFIDMCEEVTAVLGYNQRDCASHFVPGCESEYDWHKRMKHNLTSDDKQYNIKNSELYKEAVKNGDTIKRPYMDFWHFQIEMCVNHNFQNDSTGYVYVGPDLNEMTGDFEPWQQEIQNTWHELYGDLADEDGFVHTKISW